MYESRFDFEILYFQGCVFVFGGISSNNKILKSCEVYNLNTNKWQSIASMKAPKINMQSLINY